MTFPNSILLDLEGVYHGLPHKEHFLVALETAHNESLPTCSNKNRLIDSHQILSTCMVVHKVDTNQTKGVLEGRIDHTDHHSNCLLHKLRYLYIQMNAFLSTHMTPWFNATLQKLYKFMYVRVECNTMARR
jgi:hypothetical protein